MKKKLLFINGHLNAGGVEKSLVDILRCLDPARYQVDLLLLEDLGDYAEELPESVHVRFFDLRPTFGSLAGSVRQCLRSKNLPCLWVRLVFLLTKWFGPGALRLAAKTIVGQTSYDCVVGFRPGIATELAAFAVKAPRRIGWWHHGEFHLNDRQAKDYHRVCRRLDQVVAVSHGCKEMLLQHDPSLQGRIIVIPNMLDLEAVEEKSTAYTPFSKEPGVTDLVTVCRLAPEKHVENAILAAAVLKRQDFGPFRWFLVGDGAEEERLLALIQAQQVQDRVFPVGRKANPYPYMRQADLLVHTSYVESQGLVILEAMALGTPCVVTESVGPKEFCVHGKNCILVPQGVSSLVDGIRAMESVNIREMTKLAQKTVEAVDVTQIISQVETLLNGN